MRKILTAAMALAAVLAVPAVTWTVPGFQQGRVLVDSGEGLPVRIHRAAFGTTLRPAELPGQLDIFGGER